ncbi:MAG: anti-sigma factor [Solirubrobacterales bacterium]|nr:anti-sigma factor [Solirubrobacterales bacterium]
MSDTALAPGAHGTASLIRTPSGWEIHLTVAGLPHLAGGRYYEGWLQDAAGERVAIGTFNDARNVTLWSGASPVTFTVLTVTVQHGASDGARPGVRVLFGAIGTQATNRP